MTGMQEIPDTGISIANTDKLIIQILLPKKKRRYPSKTQQDSLKLIANQVVILPCFMDPAEINLFYSKK